MTKTISAAQMIDIFCSSHTQQHFSDKIRVQVEMTHHLLLTPY